MSEIQVTQADQDAAYDLTIKGFETRYDYEMYCREAFARHRIEATAKLQAENAELVALLREMHHVLASETGFMQAVRGDSGKTYPWEPWEQLEPRIDAYLKEHGHE